MKDSKGNKLADLINKKPKFKWKEHPVNLILMLLYPVVTFYLLEWFTHDPFKTMKSTPQILNVILFELLFFLLYSLIGRAHIALMAETVFFLIYGLANYFVLSFRSIPIQPWDIFSVRTAMSVANNYEYTLTPRAVQALSGFIILLILEFFCRFTLKKGSWKFRLPAAVLTVALLFGFVSMFRSDEIVQQKLRLYDKLFTPTTISFKNGTAVAFVMELRYISVEKPAGYRADDAQDTLASFQDDTPVDPDKRPNIIVIMNEAFSDLSVLGDFTANEDPIPFLRSLMEGAANTVSGYLNVSVMGGNTANTEFEYLTGNTMAFLPQGSIPYQQYMKGETPSMASYLASLGYQTVAMHPYYATGWDRNKVYPWFGFQEMYFIDDFVNPELVRKYVSDKADYDKIIDVYEKKEDGQPLFLFNVTMQNHSSYTEEFSNFTPDIEVEGSDSKALNQYLSLIKLSDKSLSELVHYFEQEEEDTVIVFFGDHQPSNSVAEPVLKLNGKSNSTLTDEELSLRYQVPYFIWANYEIEGAVDLETSVNYLGAKTLRAAGLPLPSYFKYLESLSEQVPVISANHAKLADGTFTAAEDQGALLDTYRGLQYYQLFDNK